MESFFSSAVESCGIFGFVASSVALGGSVCSVPSRDGCFSVDFVSSFYDVSTSSATILSEEVVLSTDSS